MRYIPFFCFLASTILSLSAQDSARLGNITDRINHTEKGKGSVRVIQDDAIAERIGKPVIAPVEENEVGPERYIEVSGWRIQVFSGNNQRVSKNEAFHKEADIKSIHSDLGTYVTYNAPFWRLKVGDFQSYQEARIMLLLLRREFPSFGREMSIVRDRVQVKAD